MADFGLVLEEFDDVSNAPIKAVVKAAQKALLKLIVMCDFLIFVTKTLQFYALMNIFNASLAKKLLKTDTTIFRWLVKSFKENFAGLKV